MPAVVEPGSAAGRVRFHEAVTNSEAADVGGDIDLEVVPCGLPAQGFELQEDPSFWKDHNVQVAIRIRPLSSSEISLQGHSRCVRQDNCQTITWTAHPESRFTFDLIADEHVSQEKLFKVAGVPMVENCVAGYNSCMFAYGQTGSGKTHTMIGDIEGGTRRHSVNCGMTPRVFEHLFSRIQKEKEDRRDEKLQFTCRCSFLEIYNEHILDLLNPSSVNLQIREDSKKGVYVENLSEFEVSCARDVMQQLIQGSSNRKVAATNMNRASSRSHSVFTCVIESKWESQGVTHHRFARLNLVDLAGSERQKSSGAEGDRLKEATNINKSLSTLGLVIMNLVSMSNKKSLHVPYRDSKLTFLLQDSLGGNSKTIIIANISPSNCCALETLSTLKFAQRAKFIRNNAIVNEDASGDVISMRLQIQQLKKEVNHYRGLVNIGAGNDTLSDCLNGSPCSFKWDGEQFSPLTFDKRLSQRKESEVALVAAFRREKDKETELKAMTAEKQATEQLITQRTEEVRGLKMRLRFREEQIKRLEAIAAGKLSAETHLLQEKGELLKEIDVLRNQVDRNPEVTRFAMENLQLKEELRRLQSFVEEGEREMMNEQLTVLQDKLLEALDWRLMHEKDSGVFQRNLSSSWEAFGSEETEFLHLQAIQNQREIEALRKNLSISLETKEKLERRVDELVFQLEEQRKSTLALSEGSELPQSECIVLETEKSSDDQIELKTMVDAIAVASQREVEAHESAIALARENEELRLKLTVLIDDNNKLIELYESAIAEGANNVAVCGCKFVQTDGQDETSSERHENRPEESICEFHDSEIKDIENLQHQLHDLHEENEKLMGLYEEAMKERDEFKRILASMETKVLSTKEEISCPEKLVEMDEETGRLKQEPANPKEDLARMPEKMPQLVRENLELVRDKLAAVGNAVVKYLGVLERNITEVNELSENAIQLDHGIKFKQQEQMELEVGLSQLQERKTVLENKFVALKLALQSVSSKANYWEQREGRARTRLNVCSEHVQQKKEELTCHLAGKGEINSALAKAQQSESLLRCNIDNLKSKLHEIETQRQKTERVLFAIDNVENADMSVPKPMNFGKAFELLKSEEEKSKLSAELKKQQEQLVILKKEIGSLVKKTEAIDADIKNAETSVKNGLLSLQQAEAALQQMMEEKKMLYDMQEDGRSEIGNLLLEFQNCIFNLDLKEGEIMLHKETMEHDLRNLEQKRAKQDLATERLNQLLNADRRVTTLSDIKDYSLNVSEMEQKLRDVQIYLDEIIYH
ncbi:kinesin-like protein KIN-12G [Curcuma longa]|uniref:kinesin-like protein KIN-12G n=1 Tax=Curcuma longa TaxID=136217 RepID=UPI003D9F6FC6